MEETSFDRVNWLPRVALLAFLAGLVAIAGGFGIGFGVIRAGGPASWFRGGATAWLVAYFVVLVDNFRRRLPVQTRGGVVRREDGAFRYALPYVLLTLMGLAALLLILMA